jgi:hypothetical protein
VYQTGLLYKDAIILTEKLQLSFEIDKYLHHLFCKEYLLEIQFPVSVR